MPSLVARDWGKKQLQKLEHPITLKIMINMLGVEPVTLQNHPPNRGNDHLEESREHGILFGGVPIRPERLMRRDLSCSRARAGVSNDIMSCLYIHIQCIYVCVIIYIYIMFK